MRNSVGMGLVWPWFTRSLASAIWMAADHETLRSNRVLEPQPAGEDIDAIDVTRVILSRFEIRRTTCAYTRACRSMMPNRKILITYKISIPLVNGERNMVEPGKPSTPKHSRGPKTGWRLSCGTTLRFHGTYSILDKKTPMLYIVLWT
ncbi:hypothetical protein GGR51DRAFT_383768 [Nemania sp. FL0031]|nr:hypothetical protein GGR51DRAFT_383768 [Nemania sp. FL0031]